MEELKAVGLAVPGTVELCWTLRQEGIQEAPLDALSDEEFAQALYQLLRTDLYAAHH